MCLCSTSQQSAHLNIARPRREHKKEKKEIYIKKKKKKSESTIPTNPPQRFRAQLPASPPSGNTQPFAKKGPEVYLAIPIFRQAPTTSTSSHLGSAAPASAPPWAWFFLRWMYASVFLKCRAIMSGVWTPSTSPGGARCEGCTSCEVMLSIPAVISSTRLLTNLGVI